MRTIDPAVSHHKTLQDEFHTLIPFSKNIRMAVGEKFGHHYALAPADFEESALCANSQGTGKSRTQLVSLTSCVPSRMPPVMQ